MDWLFGYILAFGGAVKRPQMVVRLKSGSGVVGSDSVHFFAFWPDFGGLLLFGLILVDFNFLVGFWWIFAFWPDFALFGWILVDFSFLV